MAISLAATALFLSRRQKNTGSLLQTSPEYMNVVNAEKWTKGGPLLILRNSWLGITPVPSSVWALLVSVMRIEVWRLPPSSRIYLCTVMD